MSIYPIITFFNCMHKCENLIARRIALIVYKFMSISGSIIFIYLSKKLSSVIYIERKKSVDIITVYVIVYKRKVDSPTSGGYMKG